MMRNSCLILLLCSAPLLAGVIPGDSEQGRELFATQNCVFCHSVKGAGGNRAPDLAKGAARFYTPSSMASYLWNHAPAMFSAMDRQNIERKALSPEQAADLYAYFYVENYFVQPGDAGRGKRLFQEKGCAGCHGLDRRMTAGGKPVSEWDSVADPLQMARAMWNHAPQMRDALAAKGRDWPELSASDMRDISLYLRTIPGPKRPELAFRMASPETGRKLYELKGCATCHTGEQALEGRSPGRTMHDFAAAMWNHAPKMIQLPPALNDVEMQRIAGYLWASQYFEARGNAGAGKAAFENKGCATCHSGAGPGSDLQARNLNSISMVSAIWQHGPTMMKEMEKRNMRWPRISTNDVSNILAYLNSK